MTQCIGSPAHEMAEQYLAGGLPESEAEQFENHFFACDACHEQLRSLMDMREALNAGPVAVAQVAPAAKPELSERVQRGSARQRLSGRILAFPVPMAMLGSLAAMLLVVAVLVGLQRSAMSPAKDSQSTSAAVNPPQPVPNDQPANKPQVNAPQAASAPTQNGEKQVVAEQAEPPANELASLADVHLPGYQAPQLRDGEAADADHAAFSAGMQAYAQGDCGSALDALAKVAASAKDGVAAKLYSGLCQLKGRNLNQAETSFIAVSVAGDTPELETAEYCLAQVRLLHSDAAGAKSWLNRTIALHGDYEERAQKQIAALSK